MTEKKKNALLWGGGLLLVLGGVIYFSITPPPNSDIKVGVVTPLTGESLEYGLAMQRAYDLAAGEVNLSGGNQIVLVYEDGKCDSAEEAAAAQRIIDAGVDIILGGTCSGEIDAVKDVASQAGVLFISSTNDQSTTESGDLFFSLQPSENFEAMTAAGHILEMGYERVAIITEDTESAKNISSTFRGAFDGEVVFDETFSSDETTFWTLVSNLRNSNSDAVYLNIESPEAVELIIQQISNYAVNAEFYGSNGIREQFDVTDKAGLFNGLIFTELKLSSEGKAAEMLLAYDEEYREEPGKLSLTAAAYDSVYLIAEAVKNGAKSAGGVAGYLDGSVVDWQGALGTINFDDNGSMEVEMSLMKAVGGELVAVE